MKQKTIVFPQFETQSEKHSIFFRHFVEYLIRLTFLKFNAIRELPKNVENIILKIADQLESKKKRKELSFIDEAVFSIFFF